MLEYIKLELYLLGKLENINFLMTFLKKNDNSLVETKEFLKKFDNFDFLYIMELFQKNYDLIETIGNALTKHYFSKISTKNPEAAIIFNLIEVINSNTDLKVNGETFGRFFALCFVLAFNQFDLENSENDGGFMWVNRYSIIFYTINLFNNFNNHIYKKLRISENNLEDFGQNCRVLV